MNTTADRIKEAMELRGLRQADLVEKTGISKGALSSYISGRYTPKQTNTYLIAKALDVNEAWLMGSDVPMERNDYEDPNILKRDAILNDIDSILTKAGYILSCESYDDDYFLVKNSSGQTITGFPDCELLARYDSLKRRGKISAELLISSKTAFIKYLESLGYRICADDPGHRPFLSSRELTVRLEYNTLDSLRIQIDKYTKATIDSKLLALKEKELRKERIEKERLMQYLSANAAHERTDTDFTDEDRQSDEDMLD